MSKLSGTNIRAGSLYEIPSVSSLVKDSLGLPELVPQEKINNTMWIANNFLIEQATVACIVIF